jgi:hypothetical protein
MTRYDMFCYVMLCYVTLRYVMLFHVTICFICYGRTHKLNDHHLLASSGLVGLSGLRDNTQNGTCVNAVNALIALTTAYGEHMV